MAIQYYMRAFNTTLVKYVDWVVNDTPDSTGAFSGFPTNQLINITVNRIVESKVANFLKQNQSLGGTDGFFFHVNSYDWRNAVTPIAPPTSLTGLAVERGVSAVTSITTASNASPIVVTAATNHGLTSGQIVTINGVTGNVAANGSWPIVVLSLTTFSLTGSTGSGAYVSGGSIFTPSDFSTLTWDETNSLWRFVVNTKGDGTTLGASQSVKVNNFFIDGYLALGSPPLPTHGIIRLPNNQYIFGENAQGTGDIQLLGSDPLNRIKLGSLVTDIVYTPGIIDVDGYISHDGTGTNVASVGFIREQNNTAIVAYKNVNTAFADITALSSNTLNQIVVGDAVNTGTVYNTSTSSFNITAATATNPVQITVSAPTTFVTGQFVYISGIVGTIGTDSTNGLNFNVNGKTWQISVINSTNFTLTGSLGSGLVYTSGGTATTNNVHQFQVGAVASFEIGINQANSSYFARFPTGATTPLIYQATASSGGSGQNLTIQSQNAGQGGTNGGNLTLTTGTGATNGVLNMVIGSTARVTLNDTTETHIHPTITFASAVVAPTITQNSTTTAPTTLTISAQPTTQAATIGGALNLSSGTGTSASGNVNVQTGGTNQIIVSPTFITPGTTTSTGGSVVIRGSLEVVGTTTTVDSTVVDIIGRIIHANWADPVASPNVAVPSQVVGYSVHRGNTSGVPRDGAAWIWTEGALNSGADGYWRSVTYPGDGIGTDNFTIANSLNIVGTMANDFAASSDPNPILGFLAASGSFRAANNVPTVVGRSILASTTLTATGLTNGSGTLPLTPITVVDTTQFTTSGSLLIQSSTGTQTVTYTGKTGTSFTGAAGGTGTIVTGGIVAQTNASTTIAAGSNNVALPTGTINVATNVGFPASGTLRVVSRTSASATAAPSVQTITYTGLGSNTFTGCSGGTGTMFTGDSVTSTPSPGISDLVLLGTDFGNRILYGSPSNNTGHLFNTPTGFFYDFQVNSVSQVQLGQSDVDASGFFETIQVGPTVNNPRLIQQTLPNTGATNGFNLGVFAQAGQLQTGGNANNNGGLLLLASGAQGTGGSGAAGIDGYVELRTGFTSKMRVFPTLALSAADNNSILYFENLFRVDTAQTNPVFRQDLTAGATGQAYTIQAQNAATTGGALVLTSGTGTTAGNVQLQTGGVDKQIVHPTFNEFRDTAEALRITPVSAGTTQITYASTVTAAQINQTTTGAATGANMTIQSQNAATTGGVLTLTTGTGATNPGNMVFQIGGTTLLTLFNTAATPNTLQWLSTTTSPVINQQTTGGASGQNLTLQSQNAATTGGNLTLTSGTGGTVAGNVNIQTGAVTRVSVQPTFTSFSDAAEAVRITPVSTGTTQVTFATGVTTVSFNQTATAGATGAPWTIQAQTGASGTGGNISLIAGNATTTGGNAIVTSGTGATAGNVQLQTGAVDRVVVHPTFTEFRDAAEALRVTPVSAGTTLVTFASTVTAVSILQTTTAGATGAATTVQAQNAATTGGALNLTSGTGGTTNGAVNLQVGGTTTASVVTNKFVYNKGRRRNITSVSSGATYTTLATDDYIAVTTLTAAFQINLPATPTTGDSYEVKDTVGAANTFNVTVSGNGNNIDGLGTFALTQAYASAAFTYTGTQWSLT